MKTTRFFKTGGNADYWSGHERNVYCVVVI